MRVLLAVALLAAAVVAPAAALDEALIKCKVCDRAIAHIWHQGVEVRTHCKVHGKGDRCDLSNVDRGSIEAMVHSVCDDLPKTHQALADSEFEMVLDDDPQHDAAAAAAITQACSKWLHGVHGAESMTRLIFANLDAGKRTQVILHSLQNKFCHEACTKPAASSAAGDL